MKRNADRKPAVDEVCEIILQTDFDEGSVAVRDFWYPIFGKFLKEIYEILCGEESSYTVGDIIAAGRFSRDVYDMDDLRRKVSVHGLGRRLGDEICSSRSIEALSSEYCSGPKDAAQTIGNALSCVRDYCILLLGGVAAQGVNGASVGSMVADTRPLIDMRPSELCKYLPTNIQKELYQTAVMMVNSNRPGPKRFTGARLRHQGIVKPVNNQEQVRNTQTGIYEVKICESDKGRELSIRCEGRSIFVRHPKGEIEIPIPESLIEMVDGLLDQYETGHDYISPPDFGKDSQGRKRKWQNFARSKKGRHPLLDIIHPELKNNRPTGRIRLWIEK